MMVKKDKIVASKLFTRLLADRKSLRMRLIAYFLLVAVLVGVVGVYSYINTEKVDVEIEKVDADIETIEDDIHKLDDTFELLLKHNIPELDSAAHLLITLEKSRRTLHEYILGEAEAKQEFLDSIEEFDAYQDELKESLQAAAEAAADIDKDLADLDVIIEKHEHFHEDGAKMIALLDAGERDEAIAFLNSEVDTEIEEMQELIEEFEEDAEREIKEWSELVDENVHEVEELVKDADTRIHSVDELIHRTTNTSVIVSIVAIILSIGLGLFVSQRITKPLAQLTQSNKLIIQGKFKEAQQQQQQQQQRNLPTEIKELMETRKKALQELADKKNIEETNKQLQYATKELERKLKFDEKKRLATLSILEDIDEQKKIIEKANKKLYVESLYPKMNPGPTLQLRMNGTVKTANPAARAMFGTIKTSFFNAGGIDAGVVTKMVNQQKLYQTEIQFKNHFYQATFKKDEQADLIFVYCVDITARRDAENKLRDAYDKLQLLDSAKDEFVLLTSHELKSPLFPIMGNAELFIEGALGPITEGQKAKMDVILRNAQQLKNRIDDFLDLSKIQIQRLKLHKKKHDMMTLVSEAKEDFVQFARDNNAAITVHGPRTAHVVCDRDRIKQVIANLVKNAVTYSKKEKKNTVAIDVAVTAQNVTIKVTDTGIGINAENQKKLFEKFYRVEQSARRRHQGTGVGLAICKGLVDLHNGTLSVESVLGKGSTFTMTLPRVNPESQQNSKVKKRKTEK